ncbi:hypothetical protein Tco_0351165 [Tanacetum coccineum]|uniref:Uncharacterized protein n=1 Tax=Tanacetum coccineum TaxID=301880 RepID=A0ABQ5FWX5_9ASTR
MPYSESHLQHRGVLVSDPFMVRILLLVLRKIPRTIEFFMHECLRKYRQALKDILKEFFIELGEAYECFSNQFSSRRKAPRKDVIFDDRVSRSFTCCLSR